MAVVIPVIAAWAAAGTAIAAAGTLAATMATVTGFLTVAGAALTTVGAISKNEDVMKVGGFMSLAGGIGSAFNSATAASASAAENATAQEAANAAWQSGGQAEVAGAAAQSGTAAAQEAANAAWQAGGQAEVAGATNGLSSELASQSINDFGYDAINEGLYKSAFDRAGAASQALETQPATALKDLQDWRSPMGQSAAPETAASLPSVPQVSTAAPQTALSGENLTKSRLQSLLQGAADKAGEGLNGLGSFVRNNKELVDMGGGVLKSMYGPEAEKMNFEQSIMQRRLRNLNSPIRLANLGPR
jgi:hypothetical protein